MKRLTAMILAMIVAASVSGQAPTVSVLKEKRGQVVIWTHEDEARTALEKQVIDQFTKSRIDRCRQVRHVSVRQDR